MFVHLLLSLLLSLSHYLVFYSTTSRSLVEGVTMYSWLVTVLLLASAANGSGGQGASEGVLVCIHLPLTGTQVPIPSYTCTEPDEFGFNDQGRCTVSGGLRTCKITEGSSPDSNIGGLYIWNGNTNPFVVLDIPQGWCVESVKVTFRARGSIPTLSISVHSAECLSTNTGRTMFSLVSEASTTPVMMNLTTLARGKYLRINMTSTGRLYLQEIEVFGTSRYTHSQTPGTCRICYSIVDFTLSQVIAPVHIHSQLVGAQQTNLLLKNASRNDATSQYLSSYGCTITMLYM